MHEHLSCTLSRLSSSEPVAILRVSRCLPGLHPIHLYWFGTRMTDVPFAAASSNAAARHLHPSKLRWPRRRCMPQHQVRDHPVSAATLDEVPKAKRLVTVGLCGHGAPIAPWSLRGCSTSVPPRTNPPPTGTRAAIRRQTSAMRAADV